MPLRTLIAEQQIMRSAQPMDDREGAKPDETKGESYKLAEFFVGIAKQKLGEYQKQYKKNQERRLGENVYALPKTRKAANQSKNFNRSVRAYQFAMVDHL